jgi:hypothetical protein
LVDSYSIIKIFDIEAKRQLFEGAEIVTDL